MWLRKVQRKVSLLLDTQILSSSQKGRHCHQALRCHCEQSVLIHTAYTHILCPSILTPVVHAQSPSLLVGFSIICFAGHSIIYFIGLLFLFNGNIIFSIYNATSFNQFSLCVCKILLVTIFF